MKNAQAALLPPVILILAVAGCVAYGPMGEDREIGRRVPAEFVGPDGNVVGNAILNPMANGVLIDVELRDLEPGWHGFHVHETGRCDTPRFTSAGEHYNPDNDEHGFATTGGPHDGDLPNIYVHEDGTAAFQVFTPNLTLARSNNRLLDADGAALIVHSGTDDYESQPSGESGEHIACAVIER